MRKERKKRKEKKRKEKKERTSCVHILFFCPQAPIHAIGLVLFLLLFLVLTVKGHVAELLVLKERTYGVCVSL